MDSHAALGIDNATDIPVLPLTLNSAVNSIRKAGESPADIVDGPHCRPSRSPRTIASISTDAFVPVWNRPLFQSEFRCRLFSGSPSMTGSLYNLAKRSRNCTGECSATISGFFLFF